MNARHSVLVSATLVAITTVAFGAAADPAPRQVFEASARLPKFPLIGDRAPAFEAQTTHGDIAFPGDYAGKWVILFSHPADFTPVCTSEFVMFSAEAEKLKNLNTELVGLSVDTVQSHKAWKQSIKDNISFAGISRRTVPFPIIADQDQEVAWAYGMLHPTASTTHTIRAVFIIDPRGIIRMSLYYPPEVGRNIAEIERALVALQTSDTYHVATPANWTPGQKVLLPPPPSAKQAKKRPGATCQEWYFCEKSLVTN